MNEDSECDFDDENSSGETLGRATPSANIKKVFDFTNTAPRTPRSFMKIPTLRKMSNSENDSDFQLGFDINKGMLKRKKAMSVSRHKGWGRHESKKYEENLIKVMEENIKLEQEMTKMKSFSTENKQLREQLINAKSQLSEQEKKIMNEKDQKINEIAERLNEREEKYKNLLKEFSTLKANLQENSKEDYEKLFADKEKELEKINHQNATYRAQLIDLRISMSKTRDLGRFSTKNDEHAIVVKSSKLELEDAKERIIDLEDKVKEQNCIITIMRDHLNYYKNTYEDKKEEI